jgi:hypothetical protein
MQQQSFAMMGAVPGKGDNDSATEHFLIYGYKVRVPQAGRSRLSRAGLAATPHSQRHRRSWAYLSDSRV